MKRTILAALAWLVMTPAWAGVSCSVPFQLQNNTTADATQVMANYNALIACLANAAAAGANNDITSLAALSTPISPAQGGTQMYVGSADTGGDGNTHVVASTTPSTFTLTAGKQVTFVASLGNSGPATLNVASTGAISIYRRTQLGLSAMVGGEIVANYPMTVVYNGAQYVCLTCGPYLVGAIQDYAGSTAPQGWMFIDGSCQVRATFADLFTVIGTAYDPTGSTCDVAHFALPDGRGRVLPGLDTLGTRITLAGSSCNGAVLGGAGCGAQNRTIAQANIPNYSLPVTDPGHVHTVSSGSAGSNIRSGTITDTVVGTFNTGSNTTGITVASGGSGTALATLPPLQVVNKIIKM